ncbi:MAG: CrcB family protein [Gemmatimonadales bacterium]|nr:MAG: CrcB family protein [Gemmatimonadales bacterium]
MGRDGAARGAASPPTVSGAAAPAVPDLAAVALGGALGTLLRAGGLAAGSWRGADPGEGDGFFTGALTAPAGITLLENLSGAAALGLLLGALLGSQRLARAVSPRLKLLFTTGLLGSFTTFSALALDGAVLLGLGEVALPDGANFIGVGEGALPMGESIPHAEASPGTPGALGWAGSAPWGGLLLLALSVGGGVLAALVGLRAGRRLGTWWDGRGGGVAVESP